MLSQAALSLVGGGISPCGHLSFLHIGDGLQLLDESAYLCLFFMQQEAPMFCFHATSAHLCFFIKSSHIIYM